MSKDFFIEDNRKINVEVISSLIKKEWTFEEIQMFHPDFTKEEFLRCVDLASHSHQHKSSRLTRRYRIGYRSIG
jgi:hypothetical protein